MDETIVERVAKAIYEADDPWHPAWPWPNLKEGRAAVEDYHRVARAAIKATDIPSLLLAEALRQIERDAKIVEAVVAEADPNKQTEAVHKLVAGGVCASLNLAASLIRAQQPANPVQS